MSLTTTMLYGLTIALQTATETPTPTGPDKYQDMWGSGNWFDAVVMPFLDLMGPLFPLVTGLGIAGILFIYSGSAALPIVTLIIIGGMLIPFMPAEAQSAAVILLLLGIALALYKAWMNSGSDRM